MIGLLVDPEDLSFRRIDADSLLETRTALANMHADMAIQGDSIYVMWYNGLIKALNLGAPPVRPDPKSFLPESDRSVPLKDLAGCFDPELYGIWGRASWAELPEYARIPGPLEIVWLEEYQSLGIPYLGMELPEGRSWKAIREPNLPLVEGDSLEGQLNHWHGAQFRLAKGRCDLGGRFWEVNDIGGSPDRYWIRLRTVDCPMGDRAPTLR